MRNAVKPGLSLWGGWLVQWVSFLHSRVGWGMQGQLGV